MAKISKVSLVVRLVAKAGKEEELAAFLAEKHVVTAEDVRHVIAEFSEEFGEEIAAEPRTEVGTPDNLIGLEKRVLGVERAMNLTVNLLRQLIRRQTEARTSR
jgi:hypothetical protein